MITTGVHHNKKITYNKRDGKGDGVNEMDLPEVCCVALLLGKQCCGFNLLKSCCDETAFAAPLVGR